MVFFANNKATILYNAQQTDTLVLSAASVAEKGGQVVSRVAQTMDTINASATRIVDIIGVIDGIVRSAGGKENHAGAAGSVMRTYSQMR